MNKVTFFILLFIAINSFAQKNPFAEFNYEPQFLTLSKGEYEEFFDQDSIVQIGDVLFNTYQNKIVGFVEVDTLFPEYGSPELVSRWLSQDPLAAEYPAWSPYNYVADNPIVYIDPDGQRIVYSGSLGFRLASKFRIGLIKALSSREDRQSIRNLQQDENRILTISQSGSKTGFQSIDKEVATLNINRDGDRTLVAAGEPVKLDNGDSKTTFVRSNKLLGTANELSHALDWYNNTRDNTKVKDQVDPRGSITTQSEFNSNKFENRVRRRLGFRLRRVESHIGTDFNKKSTARKIARFSRIKNAEKRASKIKKALTEDKE